MRYQVLARKYRPRRFSEVAGQAPVLHMLSNALRYQRLHHAYLFTGSRGVGKTSLARLFAKCLNCVLKISPEPCEQCAACLAINQNNFVDLIEIDAASRTKVEDTRELLEQVQYAPTLGRYKIYLIDEVHMLSTHSFNALLKTLEEPPRHTIFLFATTEPKRLPATILSRCLQFSLRNLTLQQIVQQLCFVLNQENISYEQAALERIAQAAEGSLRDALGWLEQAILYAQEGIMLNEVEILLGDLSGEDQTTLMRNLLAGDAQSLLHTVAQLAEKGVDFEQALIALLAILHQMSVCQLISHPVPYISEEAAHFASQLPPETVQLYYQIALLGRRDLPLAPTPRLGFEMTLLRMLAFQPVELDQDQATDEQRRVLASKKQAVTEDLLKPPENVRVVAKQVSGEKSRRIGDEKRSLLTVNEYRKPQSNNEFEPETLFRNSSVVSPLTSLSASTSAGENPPSKHVADQTINWFEVSKSLSVTGITRLLASHCTLKAVTHTTLILQLDAKQAALYTKKQENLLQEAVCQYFQKSLSLTIQIGETTQPTPAQLATQMQQQRHQAAQQSFTQDRLVKTLITQFDATIIPDSITLKKDNPYE
jgi:DNA polymerase III subunit gamma/tau